MVMITKFLRYLFVPLFLSGSLQAFGLKVLVDWANARIEASVISDLKNQLRRSTALAPQDPAHSFKLYEGLVREFLGHLGHSNPESIAISLMPEHDERKDKTAGYFLENTIVLNLKTMHDNQYECASILFTCAHEAAHCVLHHSAKSIMDFLGKSTEFLQYRIGLEKEADEAAARMLCAHGYRWVVEETVAKLGQFIASYPDKAHHRNGWRPTYLDKYLYLSTILHETKENYDAIIAVAARWADELNNTALKAYLEKYQLLSPNHKLYLVHNLYTRSAMKVLAIGLGSIGLWYMCRRYGVAHMLAARLRHQQPQGQPGVHVTINNPPTYTVHTNHATYVAPANYNPLNHIPAPQPGAVFYEQTANSPVVINRQRFEQLARTHGVKIWQQEN